MSTQYNLISQLSTRRTSWMLKARVTHKWDVFQSYMTPVASSDPIGIEMLLIDEVTRKWDVFSFSKTPDSSSVPIGVKMLLLDEELTRGVLFDGPPSTSKTMLAKAITSHTTTAFIKVVGSEFVQKYLAFFSPSICHRRKITKAWYKKRFTLNVSVGDLKDFLKLSCFMKEKFYNIAKKVHIQELQSVSA